MESYGSGSRESGGSHVGVAFRAQTGANPQVEGRAITPLKPIENTTRVRGVPSKRYPLNRICAHPECDRTDVTAHHIFGRPAGPDSDSWFVEIEDHFRGGG